MANTIQARKRARQAETRRQHNMALRSRMRTYLKKVQAAVSAGNKEAAQEAFKAAQPVVDGMVNKGLIHKNKAARHKSRMNASIKAL
ncbi:ribosomal protein S20 [gamma proteobacterium HTCC5015]|nr:ribosomal protein S20 [gamma proteobacterium HTCC5015]